MLRFPELDFEIGPSGARRAGRKISLSPLAILDDGDGAVRWYEAGLERDRALGALPFVARGQIGLGRVLVQRGGTARERGLRLIDEGSGLAHDLGMRTPPA